MKKDKEKGEAKKSLKKIVSTQMFSPIRDIRDGIIITKDGRFIKLMEFSPINFGLRSADEQNTIISQFASALRTMPRTIQFKILSRRADVNQFVEKIVEDYQTEESAGCRKLQEDQIELISSVGATQGISRRFLLAFEYEPEGSLQRRPSFEQIAASLHREGRSIANALAQCGNEQLSIDGSDEYTLELLYSIMSREESNQRPFSDRKYEVIGRYALNANNPADGIIPINDFVAPHHIDTSISPNYMIIDGLYYTFCYLPSMAYPVHVPGGWLATLINMGEGIDVDVWCHKEDVAITQQKLQYKLRYNKLKARDTEDTAQDFEDLQAAIDSGYYLKAGLSANDDFCYMSTIVTITAHSKAELDYKWREVKRHCIRNSMAIKQCLFQQSDAFIATLPICKYNSGIWAKSRRNILSSSFASAYPFVSYEVTDQNGILLGTNHSNGSLVFVDIFDTSKYNNANIAILGSSGSGKTFTLQSMALRMRQKKTQVFIIAPLKGVEFQRSCQAVDGTYVKIAPGSGNNINIMEIRKKDDYEKKYLAPGGIDDQSSILAQKIQQIHAFFSLLIKDIKFEETQLLDEALIATYERFGITFRNKSLLDSADPSRYKTMPTLADLHKVLKTIDGAGRLYSVLTRYVTGSAKSFSMPTNVDLNNQYVVLDISTMTDEMLPIGMFIALDYVWDKAQENRTIRKCIIVDEVWRMIGTGASEMAANFVLEIFKLIRGYGGSAVAATQDLNDFFALENGKYGAGIINNAKIKLLMKTEPREADVVAKSMDLTASEKEEIKKLQRGTCLLAANSNHIFIDIKASNTEFDLITSDPSELERIARHNQELEAGRP